MAAKKSRLSKTLSKADKEIAARRKARGRPSKRKKYDPTVNPNPRKYSLEDRAARWVGQKARDVSNLIHKKRIKGSNVEQDKQFVATGDRKVKNPPKRTPLYPRLTPKAKPKARAKSSRRKK